MPKFQIGDVVRVKPEFWHLRRHKDKIGSIGVIRPSILPHYWVDFDGGCAFIPEDELEKI